MKTTPTFDMDAALKGLREGKDLIGKNGILTPLIKQLTEAALQAELDSHLAQEIVPNRKNGSTPKTVKSLAGGFELRTPRDRAGTFEPQLVKKHQTQLTDEMERKILALFSLGTNYQDHRVATGACTGARSDTRGRCGQIALLSCTGCRFSPLLRRRYNNRALQQHDPFQPVRPASWDRVV